MYYSYKSKRKNRKIFKILLLIIVIAGLIFFGVKYQQYIFFWKYTYNKIIFELDKVSGIDDIDKKRTALENIAGICSDYSSNNLSAESFLLLGKIHLELGELYLNKNFTEYIIFSTDASDRNADSEFIQAIKSIKKGIALSKSGDIEDEYLLILAKACYYSKFYDLLSIYRIIENVGDIEELKNIQDIRFLAVINILNKKEDYGLDILTKYGAISDLSGRFFLAFAYNLAGKYTDSIMSFKDILENSTDSNYLKLANVNLGKIYFNQSLYKESLLHFMEALKLDTIDNSVKLWIGKNYSAMGDKIKAKAMWNEVLVSDQGNLEARKLLGM